MFVYFQVYNKYKTLKKTTYEQKFFKILKV